MKLPFTKGTRCIGSVVAIILMVATCKLWLPYTLDTLRYHADLSYTIEWGPTYWVENWMLNLGEPGIKLLCSTTTSAPRHAVSGASNALRYVGNPKYFDLFAATYSSPSTPVKVKRGIVPAICSMYGQAKTATPPAANFNKISAFLEQLINDDSTPEYDRQLAMTALWGNDTGPLRVAATHGNPAVAGRALLMLAELQPEQNLPAFAAFLGEVTKPEQLREALAAEWESRHHKIQIGSLGTPQKLEEIFRTALTAVRQDGEPHNELRVHVWQWLYWQTGIGVPITLANSQKTYQWLDSMADTVRSRWNDGNYGKGIPTPPDADAINTIRQCVTVPETDEDGEDMLNRLATEFLGRKAIPKRPHETVKVQRALQNLGLSGMTVAEILSSDREEDIRKLVPYLAQSNYFGPPTGRQKWPNRLQDIKAVRNLVKLGPEAMPVILQCYQTKAFDLMVLLNAMEMCDPDFQALFTWAETAKADELFKFDTERVLKTMAISLLAHDLTRGAALITKGLADKRPTAYDPGMRNCDILRKEIEDGLYFFPRINGRPTSEAERDRALASFRDWLATESKPGGMLRRVCWIRPLLLNRDGQPFVVYGVKEHTLQMADNSADSGGGLPYWLPFLADNNHQYVRMTAAYREDHLDWQWFTAPVCTKFSPGIQVLELRVDKSK